MLVSSHLLAEVEQTCTHVVVMHKGAVVAAGPVDEIVGDSPIVQFDVSDVGRARERCSTRLDGVRSVAPDGDGGAGRRPRRHRRAAEVVAALVRAGVGVDRVAPRRRLEDAFLALVGGDTEGEWGAVMAHVDGYARPATGYRPAARCRSWTELRRQAAPAAHPARARLHGRCCR